jgi:DNA-binding CsgD family transcriptional regulator
LQAADHVEAERGRDGAVHHAVVERHGDVAHSADRDFSVADDGALAHAMEAEDRHLGMVHERRHEESAELAGARDGEGGVAELVRGQRSRPGTVREAGDLGVDLVDAEPLARADDGDDEAVVRLHRDADVDAVEEHDLVALEPRVELGVAPERACGGVDRVRDEPAEIDAGEVALLNERHGRHLALRAAHLLDDCPPDASHRDTPPLARPRRGAHVRLDDPPLWAAALDCEQVDAELLGKLTHGRCRPHGRGGIGWNDRDARLLARWGALLLVRLDGAKQLLALLPDDDDHSADRRDVALGDQDLQHRPGARRGDLDRRLVRLHLDERLILADGLTLLDEPARDLSLGQPFAEVGQLELVGHGGAGYCDVSGRGHSLIGRDDELAALVEVLDARDRLPAVALLHGEAGIGKTSLWLAAREAATAAGYRVLSARPSEAEAVYAYSALSDLVAPVADALLPVLPAVQRRALEGALLLGESEPRADDRAICAALLGVARELARDDRLCIAVDDVQWLDAASLAALRYVLPRLDDQPVLVVLAARGPVPDWLRRSVPAARLRTLVVGGLSLGATHELLRARRDVAFRRPTLVRLWETSQGNPFFALELASALERRGGMLMAGDDLPIPTDLGELLQGRLASLSSGARDVARVAAVLAEPTVALVEAAVGTHADASIEEALEARILELDGERLRFTHPLLGSAVCVGLTPARRRAVHARLAALAPTAEERARHLALATAEPNGDIASTLEEAARTAHTRGAPWAAAELAEQALRLTTDADRDDARRRLFFAAERHRAAGDSHRAVELLSRARVEALPGPDRAAVLVRLGDALFDEEPREAKQVFVQALEEIEGADDALQASVHLRIADTMRWGEGIDRGLAHAALGVQAASRTDDVVLRCIALASLGDWHFRAGHGIARAEMDEALALERGLSEWPLFGGPAEFYGHQLVWAAALDPARTLFREILAVRRARNEPADEAWALWNLGLLEWRAGNWDEAERRTTESLTLQTQLGRVMPPGEFPACIVAAHRGRIADARRMSEAAITLADAEGIEIGQSGHSWVLGFVDLSLGDPAAALVHLRRSYAIRNAFMLEPAQRLELGDLLEALVAVGELDEADQMVTLWEERAQRVERAWALAILARSRGLLLAARGDLDGALASFERALAEHARSTDPFHHARTLLALGRTERRAKKRAAARATLEDALARFERLGAPLWADQARGELGRIGGRAPTRDDLTDGEARIAALVAGGRTNREVADALFLTVHSVETALTRIYRKLGVRSRTELASHHTANT